MSAIYLPEDVRKLLFGKNVVIVGDSVQRSIYKDLVLLIQDRRYLTQKELRKKGEESFIGDELVEGGVKGEMSNSVNYREVRHYKYEKSNINVRYFFVTIVYGEYTDSVIKKNSDADVIIMNSCLWDVHRYGEKGLKNYEDNLKKLIDVVKKECRKAIFLWGTTPPVHLKSKAGFLAMPGVDVVKINDVKRCNHIAMQVVSEAGFHFVDFDHVFGFFLHHRADDGVHWNEKAHRRMTNMLMEEIARIWNKSVPRPLKDDDECFTPHPEDGILPTPGGEFIEPDFRGPGPPFGPPVGPGMSPHFRPLEREAIFYRPRFPHDAEGEFFPPRDCPEMEMEFYGERRFPLRVGLEFEDSFGPPPDFHGPDFQDFQDRELYERERFHAGFGPPGPFRRPVEPPFVDLDEREAFFRMRPNREGMEDFTEDIDLNEPRMRFPEGFRGAPFPDDPGFRHGRFPPMGPRFPNNGLHVEPGIGAGMKRKLNEMNGPRNLPPLMPELAGFSNTKRPRHDESADSVNRKVNDAKGKVASSPAKQKAGDTTDDAKNIKGLKNGAHIKDTKPSHASGSIYGDCKPSGAQEVVTTPNEEKSPMSMAVAQAEEKESGKWIKPELKPDIGVVKDEPSERPKDDTNTACAGKDVLTRVSSVGQQVEATSGVEEFSKKSTDTILADPKGASSGSANLLVGASVVNPGVSATADLKASDPFAEKEGDAVSVKVVISGSLPSDTLSLQGNLPETSTMSIPPKTVSSWPSVEELSRKAVEVSESKGSDRGTKNAMQESPTRIAQNGRQFALAPLPKHISPIKPSKISPAKGPVFGTPEKQQAIPSDEKSSGLTKEKEMQQGTLLQPCPVSQPDMVHEEMTVFQESLTATHPMREEKMRSELPLPTSNIVSSTDDMSKCLVRKPSLSTEIKEELKVASTVVAKKKETEAGVIIAEQDKTVSAAPEEPSTTPSEVVTSLATVDIPTEEKPATKTVTKPVLKLLPKPKVNETTSKNSASSTVGVAHAADATVNRIPTVGKHNQGLQEVKPRQGKKHQRSATYTPAMRSNMPRPSYPMAQALPPQHPNVPIVSTSMQPAPYDPQQYQQPVGGGQYPDQSQLPHFQQPIGQQQQHVTAQQPHPGHPQMLFTHPQHLAHPQSHAVIQDQSVEQSMLPRQGDPVFAQPHYQPVGEPPTLSTNVALQQQQQQMYYEQLQQAELARQAREQENARLVQLEEQQRQQYLQQQLQMQGAQAAFSSSQHLTQQQMELVLKARQELQERKYQQVLVMQQQQLQAQQHIHPQQLQSHHLSTHQQIQLQAERFQRQQQLLMLQMSSTSTNRGHSSRYESNSSSGSESGTSYEEERHAKRESKSRHGDSRHGDSRRHGSSSKSRRTGHGEGSKRTSRSRDHYKHSSRDQSSDRKRDRDRTHKERKGRKKEGDRDRRRNRSRSDHEKSRKNEGNDSQYDNEYYQHLLKRVGGVL